VPLADAEKWQDFLQNVQKYEVKMKNPTVRAQEITAQHVIFDEQVVMSMRILEDIGVPWNGQVPALEMFGSPLNVN
jgi:hypothetical protein